MYQKICLHASHEIHKYLTDKQFFSTTYFSMTSDNTSSSFGVNGVHIESRFFCIFSKLENISSDKKGFQLNSSRNENLYSIYQRILLDGQQLNSQLFQTALFVRVSRDRILTVSPKCEHVYSRTIKCVAS